MEDAPIEQEVLTDKPIKPESNPNYLPELFVTDDADLIRRMKYFNVVKQTCTDRRYPGAIELVLYGTYDEMTRITDYDHLVISPETGYVYKRYPPNEVFAVRGGTSGYPPEHYRKDSKFLRFLRPKEEPVKEEIFPAPTREEIIQMTKEELEDLRKRGKLFAPKIKAVTGAIREGVRLGHFTLEEIESSEEEILEFEKGVE